MLSSKNLTPFRAGIAEIATDIAGRECRDCRPILKKALLRLPRMLTLEKVVRSPSVSPENAELVDIVEISHFAENVDFAEIGSLD